VLLAVAKEVGKNWNKVLLRWAWQRGCVIPFGFLNFARSPNPTQIHGHLQVGHAIAHHR
jgi:diketogulonate reductase-like aldo/keto reductase